MSCSHSPSKTLPSRGTVHYLFLSSAPSPGAGRVPSANTGAHRRKEKKRSNPPTRLPPYLPLLTPVHTGSYSRSPLVLPMWYLFISTVSCHRSHQHSRIHHSDQQSWIHHSFPRSPFVFTGTGSPFAPAQMGTAELHKLPYLPSYQTIYLQ